MLVNCCWSKDTTGLRGELLNTSMKINHLLAPHQTDSHIKDLKNEVSRFIKWAKPMLDINTKMKIKLVPIKKTQNNQYSFGSFNPNTNEIIIAYKDRHILDCLRTLAHEMVHLKQNINNELTDTSGETGSPEECEANSIAGILMRKWNKIYN